MRADKHFFAAGDPALKLYWDTSEVNPSACFKLLPGPMTRNHQDADALYILEDDWHMFIDSMATYALKGYDPWGWSTHGENEVMTLIWLLESMRRRLKKIHSASDIPSEMPELSDQAAWKLSQSFPQHHFEVVWSLKELVHWLRTAIKRWKSVTVVGM